MKVNKLTFDQLKRKHMGFYVRFNTEVTKFHIHKIFDYDYLLESAKDFDNFVDFYYHHTFNKHELINEHLEQMYEEALRKGMKLNKEWVEELLIVRLGNAYSGNYIEHQIIKVFSNLAPYIICEKTSKDVDMNYKVDAIIEFSGLDSLAIQIKPYSFTKYDNGSELPYHKRFEKEMGPKVHYVFYKDKDTIVFDESLIKLSEKDRIARKIEKLLFD